MDSTEKRGHGNSRFGEQSPEMTTGQPGLGFASPEWTRRKAGSRKDISKIQMEVTCLNIVALLGSSWGELVMGTQNYESKIIIIRRSQYLRGKQKVTCKRKCDAFLEPLDQCSLRKKKKKNEIFIES